jgi:diaminopimelate epimerase
MLVEQNRKIAFVKMNAIGNDFVIFDARNSPINFFEKEIQEICQKISNRKNVGCDQLILIKKSNKADCLMEIFNSDGSRSGACGNATRCVANLLFIEQKLDKIKIETAAGILDCWIENNLISVNMGVPKFFEQKLEIDGFSFFSIDVGNPHAVAFVDFLPNDQVFFLTGSKVENHQNFINKTNVEFAKIINDQLIEVRVWERGVGETLACGSGACAVATLALKNHLIKSNFVVIRFKGGDLKISWINNSIVMTGGYQKIFDGVFDESFFS